MNLLQNYTLIRKIICQKEHLYCLKLFRLNIQFVAKNLVIVNIYQKLSAYHF
jgi:hypothetical protein